MSEPKVTVSLDLITHLRQELAEARADNERLTAELNRLRDAARVDAGYDLLDQLAEIEMGSWGKEDEA